MPELKRIFGLLCLLVLSIGPIAIAGPRLIAETGAGDRWGFASDLRVTATRCNGLFYIVSMCSVDYIDVNKVDSFPETLEYFTPGTWGGKKVLLMRSRLSPSVISASPAGPVATCVGIG